MIVLEKRNDPTNHYATILEKMFYSLSSNFLTGTASLVKFIWNCPPAISIIHSNHFDSESATPNKLSKLTTKKCIVYSKAVIENV